MMLMLMLMFMLMLSCVIVEIDADVVVTQIFMVEAQQELLTNNYHNSYIIAAVVIKCFPCLTN